MSPPLPASCDCGLSAAIGLGNGLLDSIFSVVAVDAPSLGLLLYPINLLTRWFVANVEDKGVEVSLGLDRLPDFNRLKELEIRRSLLSKVLVLCSPLLTNGLELWRYSGLPILLTCPVKGFKSDEVKLLLEYCPVRGVVEVSG